MFCRSIITSASVAVKVGRGVYLASFQLAESQYKESSVSPPLARARGDLANGGGGGSEELDAVAGGGCGVRR